MGKRIRLLSLAALTGLTALVSAVMQSAHAAAVSVAVPLYGNFTFDDQTGVVTGLVAGQTTLTTTLIAVCFGLFVSILLMRAYNRFAQAQKRGS